jgi:hypothetical protein
MKLDFRHQKGQAARLGQVGQELRDWADRFSLPHQHVDRAAYYTVVSTSPQLPVEQVTALAETIFWIYVFDDFLDQRSATKDSQLQVDHDLCRIVSVLAPELSITPGNTVRKHPPATASLLEELAGMVASTGRGDRLPACQRPDQSGLHDVLTVGVSDALQSLLAHLDYCWRDLSTQASTYRFRRRLVRRQIARCMASMRREFAWNVQLIHQRELPSLASYLMTGSVSIGMHAVAAVVTSYERDAERAWRKGWAAIDTAGRIIRLANDLATYPRELLEGKVSSITLILDRHGHSLPGGGKLHPQSYPALDEAAADIRQSLQQLTDFFGYVCPAPAEPGVLTFYLQHIVAFALAAYRQEEAAAPTTPSGEPEQENDDSGAEERTN